MNFIVAAAIASMVLLVMWTNFYKQESHDIHHQWSSNLANNEAVDIYRAYEIAVQDILNKAPGFSALGLTTNPSNSGISDEFGCPIVIQSTQDALGFQSMGVTPQCTPVLLASESSLLLSAGINDSIGMQGFIHQVQADITQISNDHHFDEQNNLPWVPRAYLWDWVHKWLESSQIAGSWGWPDFVTSAVYSTLPVGWFSPSTITPITFTGFGVLDSSPIPTPVDTLSQATGIDGKPMQFGIFFGFIRKQNQAYRLLSMTIQGQQGGYIPAITLTGTMITNVVTCSNPPPNSAPTPAQMAAICSATAPASPTISSFDTVNTTPTYSGGVVNTTPTYLWSVLPTADYSFIDTSTSANITTVVSGSGVACGTPMDAVPADNYGGCTATQPATPANFGGGTVTGPTFINGSITTGTPIYSWATYPLATYSYTIVVPPLYTPASGLCGNSVSASCFVLSENSLGLVESCPLTGYNISGKSNPAIVINPTIAGSNISAPPPYSINANNPTPISTLITDPTLAPGYIGISNNFTNGSLTVYPAIAQNEYIMPSGLYNFSSNNNFFSTQAQVIVCVPESVYSVFFQQKVQGATVTGSAATLKATVDATNTTIYSSTKPFAISATAPNPWPMSTNPLDSMNPLNPKSAGYDAVAYGPCQTNIGCYFMTYFATPGYDTGTYSLTGTSGTSGTTPTFIIYDSLLSTSSAPYGLMMQYSNNIFTSTFLSKNPLGIGSLPAASATVENGL